MVRDKQCNPTNCPAHSEIVFRVVRLEQRMGRVETWVVGGAISLLIALVTQMWLLLDLPGTIKSNTQQIIQMQTKQLKS